MMPEVQKRIIGNSLFDRHQKLIDACHIAIENNIPYRINTAEFRSKSVQRQLPFARPELVWTIPALCYVMICWFRCLIIHYCTVIQPLNPFLMDIWHSVLLLLLLLVTRQNCPLFPIRNLRTASFLFILLAIIGLGNCARHIFTDK